MKGKKIIFWKIQCVDRTKTAWEEIPIHSSEGSHKEKRKIKKRFERSLYLCSSDLSAEESIYVDVALLYQEIIGLPDLFFKVKDLFQEGNWTTITDVTRWQPVLAPDYFEDEKGNPLNRIQFMEVLHDLSPQIATKSGVYIPVNLNEEVARNMGFAEVVPIRKQDFLFPEGKYEILNRYSQTCLNFAASTFHKENPAFQLNFVYGEWKIRKLITESQIKASLMEFRKLYANDEPANFKKTIKILLDERTVLHPICNYMSEYNTEFDNLKRKKITEEFLLKNIVSIQGNYIPTYGDIIDVLFNTEYFHQGDQKTLARREKVFNALPNKDLRLFAFYRAIQELSSICLNANCYISLFLTELGKLTIAEPPSELTEKEKKFRTDLLKKMYQLADIICRERHIPKADSSFFISEAKSRLKKKFGFTEDFFL